MRWGKRNQSGSGPRKRRNGEKKVMKGIRDGERS